MGLYVEGDVPYVAGTNCANNSGFFGNSGWEGIIALLVVAGLFGGGWGGAEGVDYNILPAEMLVDWVRVYQQTE